MAKDRARAKTACRIAMIEPARFNEAVSMGNYPCAPATAPGSVRIFEVNDIIILSIYRNLLEKGVIPSKAGPAACGFLSILDEYPEADRVVQVTTRIRIRKFFRSEDFSAESTLLGGQPILDVHEWRLAPLREWITEQLNEEDRIAG